MKPLLIRLLHSSLTLCICSVVYTSSAIAQEFSKPYLISAGQVNSGIHSRAFSPDSKHIVFIANHEIQERRELYSVSTKGGTVTKLNGELIGGADVKQFVFSQDSKYVIYVARHLDDASDQLYIVPIQGGSPVKLSNLNFDQYLVTQIRVSKHQERVVYLVNYDGNTRLYTVQMDGTQPTIIIDAQSPKRVKRFELVEPESAPQAGRVVYIADKDIQGKDELFSVPINNDELSIKINDSLISNGDVSQFWPINQGIRVAYMADQDTNDQAELYVSNLFGAVIEGVKKVNNPLLADQEINMVSVNSNHSDYILYRVGTAGVDVEDLFSSRISINSNQAPTTTKLNLDLEAFESVGHFVISDTHAKVAYSLNRLNQSSDLLFKINLDGSQRLNLSENDQLENHKIGTEIALSHNQQRVVYRSFEQGNMEEFEFRSVSIDGDTGLEVQDDELQMNKSFGYLLTDNNGVLFAEAGQSYSTQLFLASLSVHKPLITITHPAPFSLGVVNEEPLSLSPDGKYAMYVADTSLFDMSFSLYAVKVVEDTSSFFVIRTLEGKAAIVEL